MTELEAQLRRIKLELEALGHDFALVGGLAVSTRADPRLTRDADLAVTVADDNDAERLVRALGSKGYTVLAAVEQDATGRLATVRLTHAEPSGIVTDLLFASCGIEPDIVAGAEELTVVSDLVMPVASVGHLIAMKLLARDDRHRPLDADDLRALRLVASDVDWDVAKVAVAAISARGYSRGRDLSGALTVLRDRGAY